MSKILNLLFGCDHKRHSFPLTLKRQEGPYVCCLDCGQEFAYDWNEMRITGIKPQVQIERPSPQVQSGVPELERMFGIGG